MSRIIKYAAIHGTPLVINNARKIEQPLHAVPDISNSAETEPDISNIIANAQEEAQQIINKAQQQAQSHLAAAEEEVVSLKQNAYEEGYKKGYDEGFVKGQAEAAQQSQQIIDDAVRKTNAAFDAAQEATHEMVVSAERQIIDIAMSVAKKILARELDENPMVILPIVGEALARVKDQEKILIRVNNDDYPIVLQAKKDFQMIIGRDGVLTITIDQTIMPGSCMIDTPYGSVDARLDTKLEMVEKALQDVLP